MADQSTPPKSRVCIDRGQRRDGIEHGQLPIGSRGGRVGAGWDAGGEPITRLTRCTEREHRGGHQHIKPRLFFITNSLDTYLSLPQSISDQIPSTRFPGRLPAAPPANAECPARLELGPPSPAAAQTAGQHHVAIGHRKIRLVSDPTSRPARPRDGHKIWRGQRRGHTPALRGPCLRTRRDAASGVRQRPIKASSRRG